MGMGFGRAGSFYFFLCQTGAKLDNWVWAGLDFTGVFLCSFLVSFYLVGMDKTKQTAQHRRRAEQSRVSILTFLL
jgi:hypothetical protein